MLTDDVLQMWAPNKNMLIKVMFYMWNCVCLYELYHTICIIRKITRNLIDSVSRLCCETTCSEMQMLSVFIQKQSKNAQINWFQWYYTGVLQMVSNLFRLWKEQINKKQVNHTFRTKLIHQGDCVLPYMFLTYFFFWYTIF